MGVLCTQNCSVTSEMLVCLLGFSKCFLNYPRFLGGQGQAQGNFGLRF